MQTHCLLYSDLCLNAAIPPALGPNECHLVQQAHSDALLCGNALSAL